MEEAHCDRTEFLSSYPLNIDEISLIPGSLGRIRPRDPKSTTYDPKVVVANLTEEEAEEEAEEEEEEADEDEDEDEDEEKEEEEAEEEEEEDEDEEKEEEEATIFMGHGPSFQFQKKVPEFENIELYNVMCVTAPSDLDAAATTHEQGCRCEDENQVEENLQAFRPPPDGSYSYNSSHLPFGRPAVMFDTQYSLLHHVEFISGYSRELAVPLWSAFTLPRQEDFTPAPAAPPGGVRCLRVDSRVSADHSLSCTAYDQNQQLSPGFLFPPELASSPESRYEASLITNTVPMYPAFKRQWSFLQGALLRRYAEELNGVNVLVGPVFDHDHDGRRDAAEQIRE
ncbi:Ectonucleotide pyrophosphatase/phosphodiesterase family member 2 [Liparis tanakae]|uniref:Ectonucleotide pyrophosphatase/phosphodiesterase family member 2 n=1 Tax=Liparis tanakae TaxID=230148 RepID=A0A4Z2GTC4_9TELE|nr:Ectonucleotide pyrophosphatase/phosphodiesterase family member 2 [Liparis tanakae]